MVSLIDACEMPSALPPRLVLLKSRVMEHRTAFDLNEVVSVDPSSTPRTFLDPAVTVQTPRMRERPVPSVPPSAAVTDERVRIGKGPREWVLGTIYSLSWYLDQYLRCQAPL